MKHILMVDDNTTNLKVAGQVLQPFYQLSMAKSGKQALSFLKKNKPDLILLDINMPDMNGYETLSEIKLNQEVSNIPVIFLTASNDMDSEIRGMQMGALDYITKPFEEQVMLSRIEKVLQMDEMRKNFIDISPASNEADNGVKENEIILLSSMEEKVNSLTSKGTTALLLVHFNDVTNILPTAYEYYLDIFIKKLKERVSEIYISTIDSGIVAAFPVFNELDINSILEYTSNECCIYTNSLTGTILECNVSGVISSVQYNDYYVLFGLADKALYHAKKTIGMKYYLYED